MLGSDDLQQSGFASGERSNQERKQQAMPDSALALLQMLCAKPSKAIWLLGG
jgi:hypothetical protein